MNIQPEKYYLKDDGTFPNNPLPALHYKKVLNLPLLFPARYVRKIFYKNDWANAWESGIFEYNHYHSNAHEVLGVLKGSATVLLGGENGVQLTLEKGDVLVIPAGVAHKNLGKEHDIKCVGAYPGGRDYDMNYGKKEERPQADKNISRVRIPDEDPVMGPDMGLPNIWC